MTIGISLGQEICLIVGGFTQFALLEEKPLDGQMGAFYLGQFRLGPSSFLLRPVLLGPGATQARPKIRGLSST